MHMKEAEAFDTLRFILYTLQVRMQYKPDMQKLQVNKHYPGSFFWESMNSSRWQNLKVLCQAGQLILCSFTSSSLVYATQLNVHPETIFKQHTD